MEEKISNLFNLLFSPWGIYFTITILLYYFISDNKLRKAFKGDLIYEELDKNWKKLYIWGRNKSILESINNIYLRIQKLTTYSIFMLIVTIIIIPINYIYYISYPLIIMIIFGIWFLASYKWVLKHSESFKEMFLGMVKWIWISIFISLAIYLILIYNFNLEVFDKLGYDVSVNFKSDLYISTIVYAIVFGIILSLSLYFFLWVVLGTLPLSLILLSFSIIKLSRGYSFFKSIWFIRLIYANQILVTIIGALFLLK